MFPRLIHIFSILFVLQFSAGSFSQHAYYAQWNNPTDRNGKSYPKAGSKSDGFNLDRGVLILLEYRLSGEMPESYSIWKDDLISEGYSVVEKRVDAETSPIDVRQIIRSSYDSLLNHSIELSTGILIGKIGIPYAIIATGDFSNPDALELELNLDAIDMFYGDIDGNWVQYSSEDDPMISSSIPPTVVNYQKAFGSTDLNKKCVVDIEKFSFMDYWHIVDKEQYNIEICISRILTHNLSVDDKDEIQLLDDYFTWNHAYRTGKKRVADRAYLLNMADSEWTNILDMDFTGIFEKCHRFVNISSQLYQSYLEQFDGHKLIYLETHSQEKMHYIGEGEGRPTLTAEELMAIKKNGVCYLLNACRACRFDYETQAINNCCNYMGGTYVFGKSHFNADFGLAAIGLSGYGGFGFMNYFTDHYHGQPGATYGEMFVSWFNALLYYQFWPHNKVFIGDPTIGPNTADAIPVPFFNAGSKQVEVYPNPTANELNIESQGSSIGSVSIHSINGLSMLNLMVKDPMYQLDLSTLPKGIYIISISSADSITKKKIIKM